MSIQCNNLVTLISKCYLQELQNNYDECKNHKEYHLRLQNLQICIHNLKIEMKNVCTQSTDKAQPDILALLLILYKELQTCGPWNDSTSIDYAKELNITFQEIFVTSLDDLLAEKSLYSTNEIFEKCMEHLHMKLTPGKFKKYPSFIDVYCDFMSNIHNYKEQLNPMRTMPISLLLIEDYIPDNKVKGLTCCRNILKCLVYADFKGGNYYDVVYTSLEKIFVEKKLDITKLMLKCFIEIIRILPKDLKQDKLDELLVLTINEVFMESNFFRKKELLTFLRTLISEHKIDSAKMKKKFMAVICENLDLCMNESIQPVLLECTLQCLEMWLKHCWCLWRLSTDKKLLSILFKVLYSVNENDDFCNYIQPIIILLFNLCSKDEQQELVMNIRMTKDTNKNIKYLERIDIIIKETNIC